MQTRISYRTKTITVIGVLVLTLGWFLATAPAGAQSPTLPTGTATTVFSPANDMVAYAAHGRTIYRSDNGGLTWIETATLPSVVTAIEAAKHDASLVYIGSESQGIYRSRDGGTSWQAVSDGLGMTPGAILEVSALAIDPHSDQGLIAATGYWLGTSQTRFSPVAIMASNDGGATWLKVTSLPLNGSRVTSLSPSASRPLAGSARTQTSMSFEYSASVDELVALLANVNASPAQRTAAAQALGLLGDPVAIPALTATVGASDVRLAVNAAQALGAMKAAQAVPALSLMLNASDSASPSAAAEALAAIGTPEAMDTLFLALGNETTPSAQHAAMSAIEQVGSTAVTGLLAMVADGAPTARRNAAEMLGWIADPSSVDGLVAALQAEDPELRGQVAWALGEIGTSAALQALTSLAANDPSADVRLQATQALVHLPEQPRVTFEAASPKTELTVTQPSPPVTDGANELRTPEWLSVNLPVLRWVILALVLFLVALLPWYQSQRENRRRRHN